jgi:Ca2+:H+ antiporter
MRSIGDTSRRPVIPVWTWAAPALAWSLIAGHHAGLARIEGPTFLLLAPPLLVTVVFAAVHHAEVVAVRVGETLGVVILGLAVTTIEVSLIVSIMFEATATQPATIARDTVFAGVMVLLNGVVGLSLLVGAVRHGEQQFQLQGTSSALAVLGALACVAMILPDYTVSRPGPAFSNPQLIFVSISSLLLCGAYLFAQSVSQRADFAPVEAAQIEHPPVSGPAAIVGAVLLIVTLGAVVLLADGLAPGVQRLAGALGLPEEFVGVIIAILVLMPEGTSAVRAAIDNRLQTSLNLALGSAIQSTGLTIPAISLIAVALSVPIELGLAPEHVVLLAISLFVSTLTFSTGRTRFLQAVVHLTIFGVFLVIAAVP